MSREEHTNRRPEKFLLTMLCMLLTSGLCCSIATSDDDDSTAQDDDDNDIGDDDDSAAGHELEFDVVTSGESEGDGIGDASTCNEVNATLIEDGAGLETTYQDELNGIYINQGAPLGIDFEESVAVLSFTTYCPHLGFDLVVDRVTVEEGTLVLEETLWHPDGNTTVDGRTYVLITLPRGEYSSVEVLLDEDYML